MAPEEFKHRLIEMFDSANGEKDCDIIAGMIERTLEEWGGDRFAVSVVVNAAIVPSGERA